MKYFIYIFIIVAVLFYSCGSKNKNAEVQKKIETEKNEDKTFVKVTIAHSRIRTTPDLEAAVLERAKENAILEFLNDSTTFTSTVRHEGKDMESRWYKVKSASGNEGWIAEICISFLIDAENKSIITIREDEVLNNSADNKAKVESAPKIDSALLKRFKSLVSQISPQDKSAFSKAISLFESVFQQKASATADIAFGDLLILQEKILSFQLGIVNAAKYQHLDREIKNYGSANMDVDASSRELAANALSFGLKKNGKVYLKQNYDFLMRKFLRMLTPPMQHYLEQLAIESEQPASEDMEISAALTEIAAYAVFWDKFTIRHPYFSLKSNAVEKRKLYATILLNGLGKKTAFKGVVLSREFKESYQAMTTQMGMSALVKSFNKYYKALEESNFKDNEKLYNLRQLMLKEF